MFVRKNFSFVRVMRFTGIHLIWLTLWMTAVACLFHYFDCEWLKIPWLPLSIIGTAVAFYVGFKNNQSYDRVWEARKIWGAIVNSSRAWGSAVRGYVTNQFAEQPIPEEEIQRIHSRMIKRHIAWLYTLRNQLLIPTPWEHVNQGMGIGKLNRQRQQQFGVGLYQAEDIEGRLKGLLDEEEMNLVVDKANTATHLVDNQSIELKELRSKGLIDDFRHTQLQLVLNEFYDEQGKCERIKKFPFPRQYGSMSLIFIGIFIFLLPFGMVGEFDKLEEAYGIWISIPFSVLVGWIFISMELVGDYSENPFEGTGNDIPMLSLCRTIEIDLLQMLNESDIPPPIEAKNDVLM